MATPLRIVKLTAPQDAAEAAVRYEVVEDNGDRLLVRLVCDLPIPPTELVRAEDVVAEPESRPVDGPWVVDEVNTANGTAYEVNYLWTDEDGETRTDQIAEVVMDYRGDAPLRHANLLSAAPELLAALRRIVAEDDRLIREQDVVTNLSDLIQQAKPAIAKALGAA